MSSVLHLTRDFPPRSAGGISTAVGGLVRTSLRAGMDCAVLSFDGWRPRARAQPNAPTPTPTREPARGDSSEDGLNARVLRVSTPAQLDAARAFARDVGPSVLHVHHDMLWPLAAELRAALGVRAAVTVHVLQAEQSRLRGLGEATLSERAQAQALAEADAVLAPSRAVADALRTMAVPALDQRLLVTPLGIADADADSAAPPDAPARCFSLSGSRRPDLVVRWRGPGRAGRWVCLDAKYYDPGGLNTPMQALHTYRDALWMDGYGGRCRAGLLLAPAASKSSAWPTPAFRDRFDIGVWLSEPGAEPDLALADWLLERLRG